MYTCKILVALLFSFATIFLAVKSAPISLDNITTTKIFKSTEEDGEIVRFTRPDVTYLFSGEQNESLDVNGVGVAWGNLPPDFATSIQAGVVEINPDYAFVYTEGHEKATEINNVGLPFSKGVRRMLLLQSNHEETSKQISLTFSHGEETQTVTGIKVNASRPRATDPNYAERVSYVAVDLDVFDLRNFVRSDKTDVVSDCGQYTIYREENVFEYYQIAINELNTARTAQLAEAEYSKKKKLDDKVETEDKPKTEDNEDKEKTENKVEGNDEKISQTYQADNDDKSGDTVDGKVSDLNSKDNNAVREETLQKVEAKIQASLEEQLAKARTFFVFCP